MFIVCGQGVIACDVDYEHSPSMLCMLLSVFSHLYHSKRELKKGSVAERGIRIAVSRFCQVSNSEKRKL